MQRLILSISLFLSIGVQAQTRNILKPVNEFQQDSWSCGVHSTYRSLHNYDLAHSYGELKAFIGQHEFKYNLTKEITERVKSKVCKKLGPLKHFCEEVVKVVTRITTVTIPMNLGIGRSPPQLSGKINDYGVHSQSQERMSIEELEQLIDRHQPVLILIQVGVEGWGGQLSYPKLHWIVVNGYDAENIYYYNTEDNLNYPMPRGEFYKEWDWNNGWNKRNSLVHLHLTRNEGLEVRSLVYFDDEAINRVVLLEQTEAAAVERLAAADSLLIKALSDSMITGVVNRTQTIEQSYTNLDQEINGLLDALNPLLTEQ